MATVLIGHTAVVIEDCEDDWTAAGGGATTAAKDTDEVVGTYSVKLVVGAAVGANTLLAYEDFSAKDLSGYTYFALWVKSTVALSAGDMQILLDNTSACASPYASLDIPAVAANTWTRVYVAGTGQSGTVSVGIKQVVDKGAVDIYIDDIIGMTATVYTLVHWVKGVDDADAIEQQVAEPIKLLDGSYHAVAVPSFNRVVTIEFGPHAITTKAGRLGLLTAWKKSEQRIIYGGDEVTTVRAVAGFGAEWLDGLDFAKSITLQFKEKTARTTDPPGWT